MVDSILVALDGSEPSCRAVDLAAGLAAKCGCALILLHVQTIADAKALAAAHAHFAQVERSAISESEMARAVGEELLERAEARARDVGAEAVTTLLRDRDPASVIVEMAKVAGAT